VISTILALSFWFRNGTRKKTAAPVALYVAAACLLAAQTPLTASGTGGSESVALSTRPGDVVPPSPTPEEEVLQLGSAQTGAIKPIRLQGVVTFVHTERATFFLSDPTGGVAVALADERLVLPSVGESVTLTGFTEPGMRFPLVRGGGLNWPMELCPGGTSTEGGG
jgi:hypothetical protein